MAVKGPARAVEIFNEDTKACCDALPAYLFQQALEDLLYRKPDWKLVACKTLEAFRPLLHNASRNVILSGLAQQPLHLARG